MPSLVAESWIRAILSCDTGKLQRGLGRHRAPSATGVLAPLWVSPLIVPTYISTLAWFLTRAHGRPESLKQVSELLRYTLISTVLNLTSHFPPWTGDITSYI